MKKIRVSVLYNRAKQANTTLLLDVADSALIPEITDEPKLEWFEWVDKKTGKYEGENCWGEEKVRRFKEKMPKAQIESFYSDSRSDTPMARLATGKSYLVKDDTLTLWDL